MKKIGIMILLVLLLGACGSNKEESSEAPPPRVDQESIPVSIDQSAEIAVASTQAAPSENLQPNQQRIVIKDAKLNLIVKNPTESTNEIISMAERMGGWVISSQLTAFTNDVGEDVTRSTIAIRVPAENFNTALEQIKGAATKIVNENITGQDVTQEYVDLNSRVTNLQATERQYQTFLESATNIDEVLRVYNEISRVRGEIETMQGRIRYFQEASAYSSITVDLNPEEPESEETKFPEKKIWKPRQTAENALDALGSVLQTGADALIWFGIFILPVALIIVLPAAIMYRFIWPRFRS